MHFLIISRTNYLQTLTFTFQKFLGLNRQKTAWPKFVKQLMIVKRSPQSSNFLQTMNGFMTTPKL